MADFLLINANNSNTKFALANRDSLGVERKNVETRRLNVTALKRIGETWDFDHVVLSSVVPAKAKLIRQHFGDRVLEIGPDLKLGIELDYPEPETIGTDRLVNAVAALALFDEAPTIAVDFGTAVTFDVISAERKFVGGVIAPGLSVMTDYMHERTALLPKIDIEEPMEPIGKSTRGAMLAGAVIGYRGMIEEILRQLSHQLEPRTGRVKTIATGGYAELISKKIGSIDAVLPDLTLEGMRIIANLNLTS